MASTETIIVTFTDPEITEKAMIDRLLAALTYDDFMTADVTEVSLPTAEFLGQAVVEIVVQDSDLSEVDIALYNMIQPGDCDYEVLADYEDLEYGD